ncbi:MAG: 50S ribosomal protein L5 [Lentisphaerae bacterium]|nr:50S ribosomal protein L5 [Lentisphaerota bacterium]
MVRLKEKYVNEIRPRLMEDLSKDNVNSVPRICKVVVNMGIGTDRRESAEALATELSAIVGQKAVLTRARLSISNFKLREGMTVGAKVSLRGSRMYEFLDRLISAALPRIRDFRGLSPNSFDGRGNYTIGIKEQTIFPEIDPNNVSISQGMDITIVTSSETDGEARMLLELFGVPFAKTK